MAKKKRKRSSTPKGYQHSWKYTEKDYSKGNKIKIYQSKRRTKRAKTEGSFRIGSKITWGWKGTETIIPKGNKEKHIIKFKKRPIRWKIKKG